MSENKQISAIVYNSMFSVMGLVLAFLGKLSVFPVFPFLKADFSDSSVFLAALMCGIPSGITTLLIVSVLRALLFSSSGWIGLIIRLTSGILIFSLALFRNKKINITYKIILLILSIGICLAVKLSLNYFFWTRFFYISPESLNALMATAILPYNIVKILSTITIAVFAKKHLDKITGNFKC